MRDNGAIEGAAAGFAEDDTVIVMMKHDGSEHYVVAHTDGVVACGSLSIYFGGVGTSSGAGLDCWCLVWDVRKNDYKKNVPLNRSDENDPITYASFPCMKNTISDWLSEQESPDIYGQIFPGTGSRGSTNRPSLNLNWWDNDSDSVSVPAIVGGGTNTGIGVATASRSDVITPNVGEEWHNRITQSTEFNITDADGKNGTINYWPAAWSQEHIISTYFQNAIELLALFLTSVMSSSIYVYTTDGYHGFFDQSSDYSDALQTNEDSAALSLTTPFGDIVEIELKSDYSTVSSPGGDLITGTAETIPTRSANPSDTYQQYRNLQHFYAYYTKTLMAYAIIILYKVRTAIYNGTSPWPTSYTYTLHRKILAGFNKCEDTKDENPLDITRNSLLEDAMEDVLIKQAADIDMSVIPEFEGAQLTDRYWTIAIFGGKNN